MLVTMTDFRACADVSQLGYVGGEIGAPSKTIPRILNSAMMIVISLYVLTNVAYIVVLPPELLGNTDTIALVSDPAKTDGPHSNKNIADFS